MLPCPARAGRLIEGTMTQPTLITNTPRGAEMFKRISKDMITSERPQWQITEHQQRLSKPVVYPAAERARFWEIFRKEGLEKAL